MKCEAIQELLFDYLARELGTGRSDLVREHLRRCPCCQKTAAEIRRTMSLLKGTPADPSIPAHLSETRRRKMFWVIAHPCMDWVIRHHIFVSLCTALLLLLASIFYLYRIRILDDTPPAGYPVTIGNQPNPAATTGDRLHE